MLLHVNPQRFEGKPLLLKQAAPDDYNILADGLLAGRIMQITRGARKLVWGWSLTGPYCNAPDCIMTSHAQADSLEDAKTAVKAAFLEWLNWAKVATTRGENIAWHSPFFVTGP